MTHGDLAVLAREWQLAAHLQDRVGIPQVLGRHGIAAMREIAIEEWMGASPVYTRRMQEMLGFRGDDVATIFKGIQLDVGAPHGFLDFRFVLHPDGTGEFTLPFCGALMDVEPMGEEFVVGMCHHIEDPTFDATAVATNPRARVRPIHRPPRVPSDRVPHCHWRVAIDPANDPVDEIPLTARVRDSKLARLVLPVETAPRGAVGPGRRDYSGPLDPDLELRDFEPSTLWRIAQEFCVQGHLLVRAFTTAIADRWGEEQAHEIGSQQLVGIAGLAAERVADALGLREAAAADPVDALARLFQVHPAFQPRAYVDLHVERKGDTVLCRIGDCPALAERDARGWIPLLADSPGPHRALDAIARAIAPRARCRAEQVPGARVGWSVAIDPDVVPGREAQEVALARMSRGATFRFASRRG
ncbi:MAG: hypothetical protein ACKO2K_00075 [Alphaproteobacteria bacterium]